jgi:ABC-2 type transport system permease protein
VIDRSEAAVAAAAPTPVRVGAGGFARNLATVRVLWWRDMVRFFRQRSRVIGAVAQPLLFWLIIGGGLSSSFVVPGASGLSYQTYFFPGIISMVVLFTSIFSTMSVIDDRHAGFLQAVLVAPGSRSSIVLGKILGGVSIAMIQVALFLVLLPWAGYPLTRVDWPLLLAHLLLLGVGLTSLGFTLAWVLDSTQGYHAVMSVLLLPAWMLSGAMFPVERAGPVLGAVMRGNPVTYAVEGTRRALYGGDLPPGIGLHAGAAIELAVVGGFALGAFALAAWACTRRR